MRTEAEIRRALGVFLLASSHPLLNAGDANQAMHNLMIDTLLWVTGEKSHLEDTLANIEKHFVAIERAKRQ